MNSLNFLQGHNKIIVLGETGSGKSELAMNLAVQIRREAGQPVRFLDMDQTKPHFRSRDVLDTLVCQGVTFSVEEQFMDAPIVPYGVVESLSDPDLWVIMDVGGSQHGALCIGQFSAAIVAAKALAFYTINPYRAFSDTTPRIAETMETILASSQLEDIHIVCDAYLGDGTTALQLLEGHEMLNNLLEPLGRKIYLTAVPDFLWEQVRPVFPERAMRIESYLRRVLGLSALSREDVFH